MLAEVNGKCQEAITVNASSYSLNHVCCVCQCSLNGLPFNPTLQTSHGYCEVHLEAALNNIGGHDENH
jgi:hypothetical protein